MQFDAGREKLPEFHKCRPEFFQIVPPARSAFAASFGRDPLLGLQRFLEPGLLYQIGAAVFNEEPRDLAIAIEVLRFQ